MELGGPELRKKIRNFIKLENLDNFWFSLLRVGGFSPAALLQISGKSLSEAFGADFQIYLCTGAASWEGLSKERFCWQQGSSGQQGSSKAAAKQQGNKDMVLYQAGCFCWQKLAS